MLFVAMFGVVLFCAIQLSAERGLRGQLKESIAQTEQALQTAKAWEANYRKMEKAFESMKQASDRFEAIANECVHGRNE
jgi:hypothetical protein